MIADHGAFNSTAQPTKYPAGFFHIVSGSYDLEAAHGKVKAVYTNKAPGGVAYRCSFRITEAAYLVERMVDPLATELEADPIELRMRSFIRPEQFPYETKTGWTYDSGDYAKTMKEAMRIAGYEELRREQAEKRARGELMGIGVSFFTETVGAGPRKHMDILGLSAWPTAPSCASIPTGKAVLRISVKTQGQGHETTFAQIVAEELGIPPEDVEVRHGDTDQTPFGLGTYGSRSTPVSGGATAIVSRKVRDKARLIAATMLEARPTTSSGRRAAGSSRATPSRARRSRRSPSAPTAASRAARGSGGPARRAGGLRPAEPHLPVRRLHLRSSTSTRAPARSSSGASSRSTTAGCGSTRWSSTGQIHGGLAEGVGIALMQLIAFDEQGNCLSSSFMDYLVPTALEVPGLRARRDGHAVPAPPARRQGRRRVAQRRLAAGDRQRGGRRARDLRGRAHRHAVHAGARVGGDAGTPRAAAMIGPELVRERRS